MLPLQLVARVVVLGSAFALLTACGPSKSSSSPSTASAKDQLVTDQQQVNQAMMKARVMSVDPSASVGDFHNLQDELREILQDVQNKSPDDLDADLQKLQEALAKDIADLMAQIQTYIPDDTTVPSFDYSQFMGAKK